MNEKSKRGETKSSMMVVRDESSSFNSLFTLSATSDHEDEDDKILLDIQQNLQDYSKKELRALANILIEE